MLNKLNLQYIFSYFGISPFLFIILDKYYFFQINEEMIKNFAIYYSNIIFVFIGAVNWNFEEKTNDFKIFYGFLPSVFVLFIIVLNLNNYNADILIISIFFAFYLQLICDYYFLYSTKNNQNVFYFLRAPLTIMITISLLIIRY